MYFWNKTLLVSESFSAHHQEFSTVHTAMVCHTVFADCVLAGCQAITQATRGTIKQLPIIFSFLIKS